ncbi:hypothetical protein [Nonomuraea sp. NPDC052265]|uniref:hypothetical protein n=1 Tax=Nonomuraea sp. NPDC052265 TaxID=3364374 RepID=UPI0037C7283D
MTDHRASFDARITFGNGGDLTVHGFRVDLPGPGASEGEIAAWPAEGGASLVGTDNLDGTAYENGTAYERDAARDGVAAREGDGVRADIPALGALLAAGVPVVEGLAGLDRLPPTGALFRAAPPLLEGAGRVPYAPSPVSPRCDGMRAGQRNAWSERHAIGHGSARRRPGRRIGPVFLTNVVAGTR